MLRLPLNDVLELLHVLKGNGIYSIRRFKCISSVCVFESGNNPMCHCVIVRKNKGRYLEHIYLFDIETMKKEDIRLLWTIPISKEIYRRYHA